MLTSPRKLNDNDLLTSALTAAQSNTPELGIKYFKEALRRDPEDCFIMLEIAKIYDAIHQPIKCKSYLKAATKLASEDPILFFSVASTYRSIREIGGAINALQQIEQIKDKNTLTIALTMQAEIYESANELEKANECLHKLDEKSDYPQLKAIKARLASRNGDTEKAHKLITSALSNPPSDTDQSLIIKWTYFLATLLDKKKLYELSFNELQKAKNVQTSDIMHDSIKATSTNVEKHLTTLSTKLLEDGSPISQNQYGNTQKSPETLSFLLGHPRSGTTLLEQSLDAHPKIWSADETSIFETHVWKTILAQHSQNLKLSFPELLSDFKDSQIKSMRREYYAAWSRSQKAARGKPVWIDKNPAHSIRLPLIAHLFPDAKIIYALRDPRDVVISSYMQAVDLNDWSINWLTLEDTVRQYCTSAQMWLDLRDQIPNQWIEVRYEDTVDDIAKQSKRATEFLGQTWSTQQTNIQQHVSQKVVYSPTYGDVSKPVYRGAIDRWKSYAQYLEPHQDKLAPYIRAFGYKI